MFDLQGNYWVPWTMAGMLILLMVVFRAHMWYKKKRGNKK